MSSDSIFVTKPYLPPLEEFIPYLEEIWKSGVITNGGPMHERLEKSLCDYLGVPFISLFDNGTNALFVALKALSLKGEVITTPFTFVATSHALLWNDITPVFVDIDENNLNIDHEKIEAAISENTTAILPVHCFGNSCNIDAIKEIADRYNLKVVYDAAHAFGVHSSAGSILNHGDLSTISFHATKIFNTFEGGAIVCSDAGTKQYIDQLKNFGIVDEVTVGGLGINGKMSEINAAFGLLQLQHIDIAIEARRQIDTQYKKYLSGIDGIKIIQSFGRDRRNFSYFPILVKKDFPLGRDELYFELRRHNVHARRYFYPLITEFEMYRKYPSANKENLPKASTLASEVLCLPIYPGLEPEKVRMICAIIERAR